MGKMIYSILSSLPYWILYVGFLLFLSISILHFIHACIESWGEYKQYQQYVKPLTHGIEWAKPHVHYKWWAVDPTIGYRGYLITMVTEHTHPYTIKFAKFVSHDPLDSAGTYETEWFHIYRLDNRFSTVNKQLVRSYQNVHKHLDEIKAAIDKHIIWREQNPVEGK